MRKRGGPRRFAFVGLPLVVMMTVALAAPVAGAVGAPAPQPSPWKIDATFPGQLATVACLDASRCIAGGADGYVAQTRDGGDMWKAQQIPALTQGIAAVACNTTCIAVGSGPNGPLAVRSNGAVDEWTGSARIPGLQTITAASCGTQASCVVVGSTSGFNPGFGGAASTSDGGRTWTTATVPSGTVGLGDVSCRAQLCVATGSYVSPIGPPIALSDLLLSTDGGRTWSNRSDPNEFYGPLDCADSQHCLVLSAALSGALQTTVTDDGGATWTTRPSNGYVAGALSCSDSLHCWSVGHPGNSTPAASFTSDGGLTWSSQNVGPRGGLDNIACPSSSTTCVAVGNDANVAKEIVNTHDGGSTWTRRSLPVSVPSEPGSIACGPRTTTCWATAGSTVIGTNDGRQWRAFDLGDDVEGITCADASHCWAVGNSIWATSDGGTTWVKQTDTQGEPLTDISCADAQHCAAVGFGPTGFVGLFYVTDDGGAHWSNRPLPNGDIFLDIACTSATHCVAIDPAGTAATTDNSGTSWTAHALPTDIHDAADVTCADASHCWVLGDGAIGFSSDGGTTWTTQSTTTNVRYPDGLACLDTTRCVAVGAANDGIHQVAVTATTDGGRRWSPQVPPAGVGALNGAACSTAMGCLAAARIGTDSSSVFGAGIIRMRP